MYYCAVLWKCPTKTVSEVCDRSLHSHFYPLIRLHELCLIFFHDLVLVGHSALIYLYTLYCFHLNFLLKSGQNIEPWQCFTCATRRKWWRVPQELAWVCRWAGCWPAKLISHSPGIHNASRFTMGTKQKVREGNRERGRNIGGKIFKDSISLTWVQVLAMETSCSFSPFYTFTSLQYFM